MPIRALLPALLAVLALAGAAHAHGERHVLYAGGLGAPALAFEGPCVSTPHPSLDVGGACRIQLHKGASAVHVDDRVHGAIAFTWAVTDDAGNVCARGAGVGLASLTIAMPCRYATVIPGAGATAGEIVFSGA